MGNRGRSFRIRHPHILHGSAVYCKINTKLYTKSHFSSHRVVETSHVTGLKLHTIDYVGQDTHCAKYHDSTP